MTLAKLVAVAPVELALHAVVLAAHPPYVVSVAVLASVTTALVIWVVEPSTMRLLRSWLHAPKPLPRQGIGTLWRIRVTLDDRAGSLESITRRLADLDANILGLHVHPIDDGVRDELVVATPDAITAADLESAVETGGGRSTHVWPTTALALVDGQTRALSLSARVVADPAELPHVVAELLGAQLVTDRATLAGQLPGDILKVPSPWTGLFAFHRPGEPFTPAESARAHRLAELAEAALTIAPAGR